MLIATTLKNICGNFCFLHIVPRRDDASAYAQEMKHSKGCSHKIKADGNKALQDLKFRLEELCNSFFSLDCEQIKLIIYMPISRYLMLSESS